MAKKQNEATPNVNATANRDIVQRLNFLYQASVYLQSITPPAPQQMANDKGKARQTGNEGGDDSMELDSDGKNQASTSVKRILGKKNKHREGRKKTTGDLARSYVQCMRVVGQKTTVKIDPSLKRSLCSNCSTTLVPGSSATVRVKNSSCHGHVMVYTCMHCKATKRIPAPPNSTTSIPPSSTQHAIESTAHTVAQTSSENSNVSLPLRRKDGRMIHPLPLSARRDAGHIVFRGNERIAEDDDAGLGICFA
ncbi:Rpr2-domain-containing protein [Pholiota conissans]|uniref:Rpr2-domain-containing protein n=1 Tax=Pholiota conissans TaxID=109636 RepID=A0A9P5YRT2_9AGAR|nr:Rpr2-domain-containing protein [Pholiota conissans]